MRTAKDIRYYLGSVSYPVRSEDLIAAAQNNGAPPIFSELLGVSPPLVEFRNPDEVVEHLERVRDLE